MVDVPNTSMLTDYDFNLSAIISEDAINDPVVWLANINVESAMILIPSILVVVGIVLFVVARKSDNINDAEAAAYAGLMITIPSIFLFIAGNIIANVRLISWNFIMPVLVITAVALYAAFGQKKY